MEANTRTAAIDMTLYQSKEKDAAGIVRVQLLLRDFLRNRKCDRVIIFGLTATLPSQVTDFIQYMVTVEEMEVSIQYERPVPKGNDQFSWFEYAVAPAAVAENERAI